MPTPFADLSPAEVHEVTSGFHRIIGASFQEDRRRDRRVVMTQDEIRRRFRICERWFRIFRGDKAWSIERSISTCATALRTELDGGVYTPDSRTIWLPQDGA